MDVQIDNRCPHTLTQGQQDLIYKAVLETLKEEKFTTHVEISVSLVNNEEIKSLNARYRNKDKETDVLSFPLLEKEEISRIKPTDGLVILGDIIISWEKVVSQAVEYGHSLERELFFLVTHSMLHLLGYDHETSEDEKDMFKRQKKILRNAGIAR